MRYTFILIALITNLQSLCSQEMYSSSLVDLFALDTYSEMLVPHPDGSYTVIGEARDVVGDWPPFAAKFSKEGELIKKEYHPPIISTGISSPSTYCWVNDSIVGFVTNNRNYIYTLNVNQTSFTEPIALGSDINVTLGTIKNCDDKYITAGTRTLSNQIWVASFMILDKDLDIDFVRFMTRQDYHTVCTNVACYGDSYIVTGWEYTGGGNEGTFRANTYARSYDHSGQQQWEYIGGGSGPDSIYLRSGDLYIDNDGGIVYTYSRSKREEKDGFGWYTYSVALAMVKLDENGQELWDIPIGHDVKATGPRSNKIIGANDEDAYIVTGTVPSWDYTEDRDWLADPYDKNGDTVSELAFISKINYEGEVIWQRYYRGWGDVLFGFNLITDQIPNIDRSGYLMVGTSVRPLTDDNETFAWLWRLHVDNYGCLVPGCHLGDTTSTVENNIGGKSLQLYPNPTSDIAVITHDTGTRAIYDLYRFDGQKIRTYKASAMLHDVVMTTADLEAGTYIVTRTDENGVVSEKLVVY